MIFMTAPLSCSLITGSHSVSMNDLITGVGFAKSFAIPQDVVWLDARRPAVAEAIVVRPKGCLAPRFEAPRRTVAVSPTRGWMRSLHPARDPSSQRQSVSNRGLQRPQGRATFQATDHRFRTRDRP